MHLLDLCVKLRSAYTFRRFSTYFIAAVCTRPHSAQPHANTVPYKTVVAVWGIIAPESMIGLLTSLPAQFT